ncbi:MAG: cob(I)yrinic acid a,c-diamide adenosyltransferase [Dehalococcoidia bacterium]|nr:cob(I)yrinic acid a,c-diamide adenosyltransferase [Dehalococcoidia bacterium]
MTAESAQAGKEAIGLVLVFTGHGKGKTTAALGLMLRAHGHGMKAAMLQFIKHSRSNFGEHRAARLLGLEIMPLGAGFTRTAKDIEKSRALALQLWGIAREKLASGEYEMIILDELSYPLQYGWIPVKEVIEALRSRPRGMHVVVTGRDVPTELIEFADLVTDMHVVKHPLKKGIKAQRGIEF